MRRLSVKNSENLDHYGNARELMHYFGSQELLCPICRAVTTIADLSGCDLCELHACPECITSGEEVSICRRCAA